MADVPLKAKIWMENYQNSGSLESKDISNNRFNVMVLGENEKLECWTLEFENNKGVWGNKLLKVDDIITLNTADWPKGLLPPKVDGTCSPKDPTPSEST